MYWMFVSSIYAETYLSNMKQFFKGKKADSMGDKVECPNCKWNWEIESADDRPYLCHKCGYDSELGDFDEVALKQWKEENYYSVNESNKKGMKDLIRKVLKEDLGYWGVNGKNMGPKLEEESKGENYMFFSNLKQMRRQLDIMINEFDSNMVNDTLNNGHDWADDHISEAKVNIDQVFDFFMNKLKDEDGEYIDDMLQEKWSEKYKKSIDCNSPKGFSQRAHCQGRKKKK